MKNEEFEEIWIEHERRLKEWREETENYDPESGLGAGGERQWTENPSGRRVNVPTTMLAEKSELHSDPTEWEKLRCKHDLEYWAWRCVTIKDKLSGRDCKMRLNRPQRRLAARIMDDIAEHRPMRYIMLKARQWGGSTMVQMIMAWIQSYHRRNWNSLICAHVKDTAATIRGMYSKMLSEYPEELWDGDEKPRFTSYERALNVRQIAGRGCKVTLGSAEKHDGVRGGDYAMAHLSEVAFWASTTMRSPERFVQAICGSIARVECSLVVMESTANGVGNFFHREWLRAERGDSDKEPIFVPWSEIEIYREAVSKREGERLWRKMDDYELGLWKSGLDLEQIKWYHHKRREYPTHSMMQAEYPTTPVEAFANTGHGVFAAEQIETMRVDCEAPTAIGEVQGEAPWGPRSLRGVTFVESRVGNLKLWRYPERGHRYIAAVDIGGRSMGSDWSVVAVIDNTDESRPEIVAQWRGHIDHDLLTWNSARIARYYNNALLVIESNTLETESTDGDNSLYLLSELQSSYDNLYLRESFDSMSGITSLKVGFHTNRSTKAMVVATLIAEIRDHGYIERDDMALDEYASYEQLPNGSYAARQGSHDDILMTRAIGLHVARMRQAAQPLSHKKGYALLNRPIF